MSQTPTEPAQNADAVGVDVQQIINAYQAELAEQVQRRILAEATVVALKAERTELRTTVQALSPGAPTVQENSP